MEASWKRITNNSTIIFSTTVLLMLLTGLLCQYWSRRVHSLSCMWVCVASTCEQDVRVIEVVSQDAVNALKQWEMISSWVREFGPFPYTDTRASSREHPCSNKMRSCLALFRTSNYMKLCTTICDWDLIYCGKHLYLFVILVIVN